VGVTKQLPQIISSEEWLGTLARKEIACRFFPPSIGAALLRYTRSDLLENQAHLLWCCLGPGGFLYGLVEEHASDSDEAVPQPAVTIRFADVLLCSATLNSLTEGVSRISRNRCKDQPKHRQASPGTEMSSISRRHTFLSVPPAGFEPATPALGEPANSPGRGRERRYELAI
jgi:hypothetical protein